MEQMDLFYRLMENRKFSEVEKCSYKLLSQSIKKYGKSNPHTAITLKNLAIINYALGKYNLSKTNFYQALQIFERTYGPPNTLSPPGVNYLGGKCYLVDPNKDNGNSCDRGLYFVLDIGEQFDTPLYFRKSPSETNLSNQRLVIIWENKISPKFSEVYCTNILFMDFNLSKLDSFAKLIGKKLVEYADNSSKIEISQLLCRWKNYCTLSTISINPDTLNTLQQDRNNEVETKQSPTNDNNQGHPNSQHLKHFIKEFDEPSLKSAAEIETTILSGQNEPVPKHPQTNDTFQLKEPGRENTLYSDKTSSISPVNPKQSLDPEPQIETEVIEQQPLKKQTIQSQSQLSNSTSIRKNSFQEETLEVSATPEEELAQIIGAKIKTKQLNEIQLLINKKTKRKFINKLFQKQAKKYDKIISLINTASSWKDASLLIEKYLHEQNIDHHSPTALDFSNLVYKRYYPKDETGQDF